MGQILHKQNNTKAVRVIHQAQAPILKKSNPTYIMMMMMIRGQFMLHWIYHDDDDDEYIMKKWKPPKSYTTNFQYIKFHGWFSGHFYWRATFGVQVLNSSTENLGRNKSSPSPSQASRIFRLSSTPTGDFFFFLNLPIGQKSTNRLFELP